MEHTHHTPENNHQEQKSGLAIAWFTTSAGGALISATIIGAIIGIPAIIVGAILAIIALAQKQKYKGLSIAAISISGATLIAGGIFLFKAKQIVNPLIKTGQEIQTNIQNDPELKELMKDEAFNEAFQANLKKRMEARENELKTNTSGEKQNLEEAMTKLGTIINEETKAALQEIKKQFILNRK